MMPETKTSTQWLTRGVYVLAGLLALNALLGPLLLGVIEYRYSDSLIYQGIGLDFVAIVGAVPAALIAATLTRRGHRAGPVLAFVPSTFAAYMAPQYIVGPEYLLLDGNNEQFFLLHLLIFIVAVTVVVLTWAVLKDEDILPRGTSSDRRRSLVLFGVAAFILVGRWLPAVGDLTMGDPSNADYLENPTAYLLIGLLDLGLVVPAALAAGFGLRHGAAWARKASYAVIGWFSLVPAAVAAMAVTMQVNDDPNATGGALLIFLIAGIVFTLGAALLYRPLFSATADAPVSPPKGATRQGPLVTPNPPNASSR